MSKNFMQALEVNDNFTKTENGATALKSTGNDLVNLFASIGALRGSTTDRIISKFSKAFAEDKLTALKILFYSRDIRSGLGEREIPKIIYKFLAANYPETILNNLNCFAEYGRWDDLLVFLDTSLKKDVIKFIKKQLAEDYVSEYPSLLAKWLPSSNTSSKETRRLANILIKEFGTTPKLYRKVLSKLRKQINVVETLMSSKNFDKIDYSKVPSKAMNIYRTAFYRNDEDRFAEYIESVTNGKNKINSSTLYPYDIIGKLSNNIDKVLEEQWKALPNYIDGENNILVMADTSGSMSWEHKGRPLHTSLGLAIYFAERNKGYYKNKFMTFSSHPELVTLKGNSLTERVNNIKCINSNTNLESAFRLILDTAIQYELSQEEMPTSLVIISDMQFDEASISYGKTDITFLNSMKQLFHEEGYEMPNIIFWNVADRKDSFQAHSESNMIQLYSGQSVSTFKTLLANIGKTPYDAMMYTLNNERYDMVSL